MPLPEIPGVVRATVGGEITGGGRWANTWHARRIDLGAADLALITELHVALLSFYAIQVIPACPPATTLEGGDYTPLDGTSGAFHLPGGPLVGVDTSTALPPEVAEVLTIRTGLRGRRARGRVFLPAFASDIWTGGQLQSGRDTAVVTAALTMMAAMVVVGWEIGVASYGKSVTVDRTVRPARRVTTTWDPFFTAATSFSMDRLGDVVRGRKT